MWLGTRISVVVPAYCEERLIGRTLGSMPKWVDAVHVVDDASADGTSDRARQVADTRVQVLRHAENRGVGAAIVTGYRAALKDGADVIAVMAGDNQMDPDDLANVVIDIARGAADYVKGNRFVHPERNNMPRLRRAGSKTLAALTRLCTGLFVDDTQCGYTAISAHAARALPLDELWPRYGYPNDLLGMLAARGFRVREVPVRPVYANEQSGLSAWHMFSIARVIARRWWLEQRTAKRARAHASVSVDIRYS